MGGRDGGVLRFSGFRVARPVARSACYMLPIPFPISVKDLVKRISQNVNTIYVGRISIVENYSNKGKVYLEMLIISPSMISLAGNAFAESFNRLSASR